MACEKSAAAVRRSGDDRAQLAGERAQAVADDRASRVSASSTRRACDRPEPASERPQLVQVSARARGRTARVSASVRRAASSVPGSSAVARWRSGASVAIAPSAAFDVSIELREVLVAAADRPGQQVQVVDEPGERLVASGDRAAHLAQVAVDRPERAEGAAEVRVAPLEALAEPDDEQAQVGAAVRVEDAEDLIEVDVRERCWQTAIVPPSSNSPASSEPGSRLEELVLERRSAAASGSSRPCRPAGSRARSRTLRPPRPSTSSTPVDVADLDPGDADRLALPRLNRLRGLELGLELERALLEDRDPHPLVLDDHVADCRARPRPARRSRRAS